MFDRAIPRITPLPAGRCSARKPVGLPRQIALTGAAFQKLIVATALILAAQACSAQPGLPAVAPAVLPSKASVPVSKPSVAVPSKPMWTALTPMQQETLKPLAASWPTLSEAQKRKWLQISKSYPSLPPDGQATMHGRMNEWISLSPQQRAEARLNFAKTKELAGKLTPEEKKAKWQTYQALSAEEKQKLAAKATRRPVGAATAVKPVAPQKLAELAHHGKPELIEPPKSYPGYMGTSPHH